MSGDDLDHPLQDPAVKLAEYMYSLLDHPGLQAAKHADGVTVPRGVLIDGLCEIVEKETGTASGSLAQGGRSG